MARAYISNSSAVPATVSVLDTNTDTVITDIALGVNVVNAESVAVDSQTACKKVYVASQDTITGPQISVIDALTNTVVANIIVGNNINGLAVTPDQTRVYAVANNNSPGTYVIDAATNTVITNISGTRTNASGIAIAPNGLKAYIRSSNVGVTVIDTDPTSSHYNEIIGFIPASYGAGSSTGLGIAVTPDGLFSYFVSSGEVNVMQTSTDALNNVQALAISGSNIFAGTGNTAIFDNGAGVFLSTDNGLTWNQSIEGLTDLNVVALAADGTNVFAGTASSGVFLSINNGTSWTAVNTGLTTPNILSLATDGTNIFAGTDGGGVFLSTDNGGTWTSVNTGLTNTQISSLIIKNGTNIFAGTLGGGVFLSTNNGTSWTAMNTGLTNLNVHCLTTDGTNIFAGTHLGAGLFLSIDNGGTWTPVNSGLANHDVLSITTDGTNVFAGTNGGGVFLSTDNGTSWNPVNTGLTNLIIKSLAINGINVYSGTDTGTAFNSGGLFLSTNNGSSWTSVKDNLIIPIVTTGSNTLKGLSITRNGLLVSVANFGDDTVRIISTISNTVVGTTVLSSDGPWGTSITPDDLKIYSTNENDNGISSVSTIFPYPLLNTVFHGSEHIGIGIFIADLFAPLDLIVTKTFSPSTIQAGGRTTLTITVTNPNNFPVTNISFTDTYPAGLINANPTNISATSGTAVGIAGGNSLSWSSVLGLAAGQTATITIDVTSNLVGLYNNSTGIVTGTEASSSGASATLTIISKKKHGIGGSLRFLAVWCVNPKNYPNGRPEVLTYFNRVNYYYSYTDNRGWWCYKLQKNT